MSNIIEIQKRVAKGAALLDEKRQRWHSRIDTKLLRMSSCDHCILGQLFGDYSTGKSDLGFASDYPQHAYAHGFTEFNFGKTPHQWRSLREEWVKAIEARAEGAAP